MQGRFVKRYLYVITEQTKMFRLKQPGAVE